MLRQEMESNPLSIGACSHNKDDTNKGKTPDDEGKLVYKRICLEHQCGALLRKLTIKASEYMAGLYYVL
jgi:hypothetical protein